MEATSDRFRENATRAIADTQLQHNMTETGPRFIEKRARARAALPEFDALRDPSRDIKNHVLEHLDIYLERYESAVLTSGGHVHWAETAGEAVAAILAICKRVGAKTVTKGKSMISEEIELNQHMERAGITPVETDLGEYIIQLRNEPPSHIIAPAVHLRMRFAASTRICRRIAISQKFQRSLKRRAACCARNILMPMWA